MNLENAAFNYADTIPRWHNQRHYVKAWVEKKANVGLFRSILRGKTGQVDRQVRIVPGGGYSGPAFNYPNVQRLKAWQKKGKEVHIVYYGDLDPSGEDINRVVKRKLANYGLVGVDFQRIAVTDEQLDEYPNLPRNPDPKTLEKLKRDSRRFSFMRRHNGELFQVEVDALAALEPDAFRDMILNSVDRYFDEGVHKEALEEYSEDDITKILKKRARRL